MPDKEDEVTRLRSQVSELSSRLFELRMRVVGLELDLAPAIRTAEAARRAIGCTTDHGPGKPECKNDALHVHWRDMLASGDPLFARVERTTDVVEDLEWQLQEAKDQSRELDEEYETVKALWREGKRKKEEMKKAKEMKKVKAERAKAEAESLEKLENS